MNVSLCARTLLAVPILVALTVSAQEPNPSVKVKFHEPRTEITEGNAPIDPTLRVNIQMSGGMAYGLNAENVRLTFSSGSARTNFKIDNQMVFPATQQPIALPAKTPAGKARHGFYSSFKHADLTITQVIEAVPSQPAKKGDQRKLNTALVRYIIENKGGQARNVAMRVRIDTYCNNDGALFSAPTMPKQVLDGIELKDKTLPPYVRIMQVPNLENPGVTGHFTLKLGSKMIGPDRFLCTAHGAGENGWEVQVMQAGGDSDCAMYWKPVTVQPNATVTLAYAYGIGLATTPESEGRVGLTFGGSFEPGKLFTLTATVDDPISNQTLELELPAGMEIVEGKRVQPVPEPAADTATSVVLWKCRVTELGEHTLRIRSSSGVTQTRTITVSRP